MQHDPLSLIFEEEEQVSADSQDLVKNNGPARLVQTLESFRWFKLEPPRFYSKTLTTIYTCAVVFRAAQIGGELSLTAFLLNTEEAKLREHQEPYSSTVSYKYPLLLAH